jgi:hydroxymethylbilane synthase
VTDSSVAPVSTVLRLATRKSALALAQARAWALTLTAKRPDLTIEEVHVTTTGDRIQDRPLQEVGGKGLFLKEIEETLAAGGAEFAVHSIKDVPAELAPGLVIAAVPPREDPRDALVSREGQRLADLPEGAIVGTSSLRRRVFLQRARPDLRIVPLRGNVDTRLRKATEGEVDAVVLAYAGLRRLGLGERATEILDPRVMIPAIGQGALGIEAREGDTFVREALATTHDAETAICVAAERGVMLAVDGSCQVPVAAYAWRAGDRLRVVAMLADADGSRVRIRDLDSVYPREEADAARLGRELGAGLR